MSLVEHATTELTLARLFNDDSDYGGKTGRDALAIMKLFASQGHSGSSAALVATIVERLMRFEPLTELTYHPDEWVDRSSYNSNNEPLWQNKRDSRIFSDDQGATHYSIEDDNA